MLKSSVQDNFKLDNSYIETSIFNLFKIDIIHLIQLKSTLAKEFHIQPSEIDRMPYWEYEYFIKNINDAVKEENEKQKGDMEKYHINDAMKMTNPNNMNKMMSSATPQVPKMSMPSTINMSNMKW